MQNIQEIIEKIFSGITISEEEKKVIVGLYIVGYHRSLLEALLGINLQNKDFYIKMTNFFAENIEELTDEQKKRLQKAMEAEKGRMLGEILKNIKINLSEEDKKKIEKNTKQLLP